jgi:hypothetical protein
MGIALAGLVAAGVVEGPGGAAIAQLPRPTQASIAAVPKIAVVEKESSGWFVVVGDHDTILKSADGKIWQPGDSVLTNGSRLARGANRLVKVGIGAGFQTSSNGQSWVDLASGTPSALHAITYGNRLFVAVGNEGVLLTSPDGRAWTTRNSGTDERLRGIVFGRGQFVAVGYAGTILISKDGVHWRRADSGTGERLLGVAFGNGVFVATGWRGLVLVSSNGTKWTHLNSGVRSHLRSVSYSPGILMGAKK